VVGLQLNGSSYDTYIQSRNMGAGSAAYNLLLQPLGGNVGIGETAPDTSLHVTTPSGTKTELNLSQTAVTNFRLSIPASTDALTFVYGSSAERMRIDSSGNLLVGTTSTIPFLLSSGTGAGITSAGTVMAGATAEAGLFNRIGSDGSIVNFYRAGAIVGSIGSNSGYLYVGGTAGDDAFLSFGADGVRPATSAGAARDAAIDLGGSTNRFKDLYLSGGVYLGGTVAANKLDDYEEGTWTPALNMTSGSVSYASQLGQYTKIGNQVTLIGWIYLSGVSSPSGALNITVPFTASSTITRPATMIMANNTTGVTGNIGMWVNPNTTNMYLQIVNNADLALLDGSNMALDTELYLNITYITT
jgi:hypothetical protein